MSKAKSNELTDKQKLFIAEYLIDLNQTKAAIRAGFKESSARTYASEMMNNPKIQEAIQERMDLRSEKIGVDAETILKELLKIATVDLGEAYDDRGNLLPISDIPIHVRKAMAGVKVFEEFEGYGDERHKIGEVREVKFWDKNKSLELLGRHLKLFTDKIEIQADESIAEMMRKARERAKG